MKIHSLRAALALAFALAALLAPLAQAQAPYPNQGIRFIVPYAPGGLPDTVARITAQHLQERIGQSVVVENRAGGGAAAAVTALMGAPADGYTFIVTDGSIVSTNPALFKQLSYNPKDIIPLALLGSTPLFLAAHPDLPVSTLREFVDYVKAHPGQINYGSSGVGSIHHLSMEALKAPLKLEMTHIPYRGTGQSVPALLGGHVQVLFSAYPSLVGAVESKKVKLLANNGSSRWFQAPDVPTISEVIPGYDLATIVGLYGRPGLPQPINDKITAEAIAAVNTPEAKKQLTAAGIEPTGGNASAFEKALKREIDNVTAVVKSAGIEPQ
jgi:tripartite-type tricarboxylate transporter receptor subunit TctC